MDIRCEAADSSEASPECDIFFNRWRTAFSCSGVLMSMLGLRDNVDLLSLWLDGDVASTAAHDEVTRRFLEFRDDRLGFVTDGFCASLHKLTLTSR